MAGERKAEGEAEDPRRFRSSDTDLDRYRAERARRPSTVMRPPADRMARPAAGRDYSTK